MKKRKYIEPKIETLVANTDGALMRAYSLRVRDLDGSQLHWQPIQENDDDDFEAGAKEHVGYSAWDSHNSLWDD